MPRVINDDDLMGLSPKEAAFVIEYCTDYNTRAAAERAGYHPDSGYKLIAKPVIEGAISRVLSNRKNVSHLNAEYVLLAAEEHRTLSVQLGQMTAANSALNMIAKHSFVNAYAPDKVEITTEKEILDRLIRGRERVHQLKHGEPDDEVSFL